jgi:major membrane immunogen (membrane-anchored lipoprotein)
MMKQKNWKAVPALAIAALSLLSSCGKHDFVKQDFSSSAVAGQYVYIKPKLDLVIFQDNSDSIANAMAQLKPQLSSFVSQLDTNWEYRVVVMPLLSQTTLNSKYVLATDCTTVSGAAGCTNSASAFNNLGGDSGWLNSRNSATGNTDLGFANMNYNINNLTAGFLRPDSLKVFMIVSNGEDNTNVAYKTMVGYGNQTFIDYNSSVTTSSFNAYFNYFKGLKSSISLSKLYAVVAAGNYSNCWGGGSTFAGTRYMTMAQNVGGASYDLCGNGLSGVLTDISTSLKTVVQTVEFNYVVISSTGEPDPSTIVLKKNGTTLSQSASNGWTYVGYRSGATSDYPTVGNNQTGYMVQLNGSAKFLGTDTISIDFKKK